MKTVLIAGARVGVATCRYAPGERHAPHTDAHSRVSLVLRGGYREEGRNGAVRMAPGDVIIKTRRARHEDVFGPEGAHLVALEYLSDDPFEERLQHHWRKRGDSFALRHALAVLDAARAGDAAAAETAGADLAADEDETDKRATPPLWLARLHDHLAENSLAAVNAGAQARAAGAHPAHASRLFRRCYGQSLTEYAQTQSVRRALAALADGATLGDAALRAGFYDQSHMNRVFRRVAGRTPADSRALMALAG